MDLLALVFRNFTLVDVLPLKGVYQSLWRRITPDLAAYVIGLAIAWLLKWQTTDLVWSLWLCSLALGYITLLSALAGGAWFGLSMLRRSEMKQEHRLPAILIGTVAGLFLLGFFSLHFCGFHAGHSVFLNMFFPLQGLPPDGFGRAFMNPPLLWYLTLKHLAAPYGIFIIPALIAERKHVFAPFLKIFLAARVGASADDLAVTGKDGKKKSPIADAMGRPYLNVVRMHLMIFFFAICHAAKIDSFLVYVVVYSVYFFPWSEIRRGSGKFPVRACG